MTSTYLRQVCSLPPVKNCDHVEKHSIDSLSEETKRKTDTFIPTSLSEQVAKYRAFHDDYHEEKEKYKDNWLSAQTGVLVFSTTNNSYNKINQTSNDQHSGDHSSQGSGTWMPSKRRWMTEVVVSSGKTVADKQRRSIQALTTDQQVHKRENNNSTSSPSGVIRVCSDCSTTKTPLWRSGPQGPKSLCNACGIRQRKARRAMAAAATAVNGGLISVDYRPTSKVQKSKISDRNSVLPFKKRCALPYKKRCKIINHTTATTVTSQQKLHFDDVIVSLSDISSSYKVFPQDEKEAAILLMALSYGLLHG